MIFERNFHNEHCHSGVNAVHDRISSKDAISRSAPSSMTNHNIQLGSIGERIASDYLTKKGYSIIDRNYRSKIGEIDIISKLKNIMVFVEVKTKIGDIKGKPYEHVTKSKISKFKRAVQGYLMSYKIQNQIRLDVISIELFDDLSVNKILHFENITQ